MSCSNFLCTFYIEHNFLFIIDINGDVWYCGSNVYHNLGISSKIASIPTKIDNLYNITSICCGCYHTICCDIDGNVYTMGKNIHGELGISDDSSFILTSPTKVQNIPQIKRIASGRYFSMCISFDNKLYCFGDNSKGQLGLGHEKDTCLPTLNNFIDDIDIVECGDNFSICRTYTEEIYACGENANGQFGNNKLTSSNKPINISTHYPNNIISIKCGTLHALCLTSDGEVYAWGNARYGQLGNNNERDLYIPTKVNDLPEIRYISCGISHSMCIDISDNLWVFGRNFYGQLGTTNNTSESVTPIKVENISNIREVAYGGNTTFIKTYNNEIYGFGNNQHCLLGIKTNENLQFTPIQVFIDNENIWKTSEYNSKAKSARK